MLRKLTLREKNCFFYKKRRVYLAESVFDMLTKNDFKKVRDDVRNGFCPIFSSKLCMTLMEHCLVGI